jgi:hypothetical protein
MLICGVVQRLFDWVLARIQIDFLSAEHIGIHFLDDSAYIIELSTALVQLYAVHVR